MSKSQGSVSCLDPLFRLAERKRNKSGDTAGRFLQRIWFGFGNWETLFVCGYLTEHLADCCFQFFPALIVLVVSVFCNNYCGILVAAV